MKIWKLNFKQRSDYLATLGLTDIIMKTYFLKTEKNTFTYFPFFQQAVHLSCTMTIKIILVICNSCLLHIMKRIYFSNQSIHWVLSMCFVVCQGPLMIKIEKSLLTCSWWNLSDLSLIYIRYLTSYFPSHI